MDLGFVGLETCAMNTKKKEYKIYYLQILKEQMSMSYDWQLTGPVPGFWMGPVLEQFWNLPAFIRPFLITGSSGLLFFSTSLILYILSLSVQWMNKLSLFFNNPCLHHPFTWQSRSLHSSYLWTSQSSPSNIPPWDSSWLLRHNHSVHIGYT